MEKSIYDLKYFEVIQKGEYIITRIPFGFLYQHRTSNGEVTFIENKTEPPNIDSIIFNIKLFETFQKGDFFITKIPNGWLYKHKFAKIAVFCPDSRVFVEQISYPSIDNPVNLEHQENPKSDALVNENVKRCDCLNQYNNPSGLCNNTCIYSKYK